MRGVKERRAVVGEFNVLHRASRDDALTRERETTSSRGTRGSRDSTLALPGRERDVRERMKGAGGRE